ncbi:MAG: hypothetical protein ACPGOV_04955 [Magnetovibrionaceae bacterium]
MAEEAATATPPPAAAPPARTRGGVILHERYRIDPDTPLSDLDLPSTKAFACEDRRESGRALFCYICTPGLPTRAEPLKALKGVDSPGLLPMLDFGVVEWPPLGQRTMALIYEKPLGGRVAESYTSSDVRFNEYDLPKVIIEPLSGALLELKNRGVIHRSIRPNNLFYRDAEKTEVVLGDCCAVPPGFDQPSIFEPVERAMASPAGRGEGEAADDLYALGVTITFMLLGTNPLGKMSEDDQIYAKLDSGTYATLCGRERVPVSMLEPLRGMLADSRRDRWGPEELELWISGRKLTPIQKKATHRAEAPFRFAGRDHINQRTLARAMTKNVTDAAKELRAIRPLDEGEEIEEAPRGRPGQDEGPKLSKSGKLYAWLRRSLKDVELADTIAHIVETAKAAPGSPEGSDDFLVAKVSIILDPQAPIRYKGIGMMPDALGPTIAVEYLRKESFRIPAEILGLDLGIIWSASQVKTSVDANHYLRFFTQCKQFLNVRDPGYGMERVLYEYNPSLPCLSPLVVKSFVVRIQDLLPALEQATKGADTKKPPMDRHMAAFIAARFNQDIDPHLRALAQPDEETRTIGMLSLLAFLQWRLRIDSLHGLASWVGGLLGPAINTYHSRTTRREIERDIPKLVRQGSLPELFDLIDNAERRQEDNTDYAMAVAEFRKAESEVQQIEMSDSARADTAEKLGQQTAAVTSIVLTFMVIVIYFILESW